MKTACLTLALIVAGGSTALAQDDCCPAAACPAAPEDARTTLDVRQDEGDAPDEAQQIKELEARLNEVLIVEENGRVVLKAEYRDSLPFPAERVQQMLGTFVELGADGKIRIKNPDAIRAYLPMIRRFLSPESMERLREVQKLPPEQRADAMRRMFGGGGSGATPSPGATPQPPAPRPQPPAPQPPAPRPRAEQDEDERPLHRRERESLHRPAPGAAQDDDRLTRLEHRLDRIERMLRDSLERRHDSRGPSANSDRGRALRDLFFGRRDREDGARRTSLSELNRRARVWRHGVRKLTELLEPDDFERLFETLGNMRLEPGDIRDREKLMQKLQESSGPEDMTRFMEIFSDFIATPEGRDFADELERVAERLEGVMGQDRGGRLGDAMERLGGGELRDRLEQLVRPRREREGGEGRRADERRPEERRGERPRRLPEGAKLY